LLLLANGITPKRAGSGKRVSNRAALAKIDLHWHDLRHEALSRLADDGVPIHELQLLARHASITTTQRYMNARANSLAESMRQARERRVKRLEQSRNYRPDGVRECASSRLGTLPIVSVLSSTFDREVSDSSWPKFVPANIPAADARARWQRSRFDGLRRGTRR
jgi:hypothetical protein